MSSAPHACYTRTRLPSGVAETKTISVTPHHGTVALSVFGVGAPEAALVGVVALIVFGPQGLIDAAKAAAAALRSLQPAIQEINQASSEIRTTITNEMGIDKLQQEFREISDTTRDSLSLTPLPSTTALNRSIKDDNVSKSSDARSAQQLSSNEGQQGTRLEPTTNAPARSPRGLETFEPQTVAAQSEDFDFEVEEKRVRSEALAWGGADAVPQPQTLSSDRGKTRLEDMTTAELELELERRRNLIKAIEDLNT